MVTSIGSGTPLHGNATTSESGKTSVKPKGDRSASVTSRPGRKLEELSSGIKVGRRGGADDVVKIKHSRLAASSSSGQGKSKASNVKSLIRVLGHAVDFQESLLSEDSPAKIEQGEPGAELSRISELVRILSDSVVGGGEQDAAGGHTGFVSTIDSAILTPFFELVERSTEALARPDMAANAEAIPESDPRPALLASLGELKEELRELNKEFSGDSVFGGFVPAGHVLFTDGAALANAQATQVLIAQQSEIAAVAHDPIAPEEALVLLQD